ncbi:hypothetical protein EV651_10118 [Kribbella sp. VKM Ac-2571]|nr:hypothetical protein EV651_10118 [Kribbella sp. VKM Ac-2571]
MGGLRDRPPKKPGDHKSKVVQKALKEILKMGDGERFKLVEGGHWGLLVCDRGCCMIGVDHTPRNEHDHASDLLADARACPLQKDDVRNKRR